jgi:hypothetical protein
VAGYIGYVAQEYAPGASTEGRVETRPAQSADTNVDQDLVEAGASSSTSYLTPAGAQVGAKSTVTSPNLNTTGPNNVYTEDLNVDFTAANVETITSTLYDGVGTGGTVAYTFASTSNASTFETSAFDTFAFGWYSKAASSVTGTVDVSQIEVLYTPVPAVPEPATIGLLGLSCIGLLQRRSRKRA